MYMYVCTLVFVILNNWPVNAFKKKNSLICCFYRKEKLFIYSIFLSDFLALLENTDRV